MKHHFIFIAVLFSILISSPGCDSSKDSKSNPVDPPKVTPTENAIYFFAGNSTYGSPAALYYSGNEIKHSFKLAKIVDYKVENKTITANLIWSSGGGQPFSISAGLTSLQSDFGSSDSNNIFRGLYYIAATGLLFTPNFQYGFVSYFEVSGQQGHLLESRVLTKKGVWSDLRDNLDFPQIRFGEYVLVRLNNGTLNSDYTLYQFRYDSTNGWTKLGEFSVAKLF